MELRSVIDVFTRPSGRTVTNFLEVVEGGEESEDVLTKAVARMIRIEDQFVFKRLGSSVNLVTAIGPKAAANMALSFKNRVFQTNVLKQVAGVWKRSKAYGVSLESVSEAIDDPTPERVAAGMRQAAGSGSSILLGLSAACIAKSAGRRVELPIGAQKDVLRAFTGNKGPVGSGALSVMAVDAAVRWDEDPEVGGLFRSLVEGTWNRHQGYVFSSETQMADDWHDKDDRDPVMARGMSDVVLKWMMAVVMDGIDEEEMIKETVEEIRPWIRGRTVLEDFLEETITAIKVLRS